MSYGEPNWLGADYSHIEQRILVHMATKAKAPVDHRKKPKTKARRKSKSTTSGTITGRLSPFGLESEPICFGFAVSPSPGPFDERACLERRLKSKAAALDEIQSLLRQRERERAESAKAILLKDYEHAKSVNTLLKTSNDMLFDILRAGSSEGAFPRRPQQL